MDYNTDDDAGDREVYKRYSLICDGTLQAITTGWDTGLRQMSKPEKNKVHRNLAA